jgi:NAD-dependent DNA ligase
VPFPDPEGVEFTYNDAGARVFGYVEAPLAGRVERMFLKCGIKGIRDGMIVPLVEAGLIRTLGDAFRLSPGRVAKVEGFAKASADNLCGEVDRKSAEGLADWEILASVGIIGIGRTVSRLVLKEATLGELMEAVEGRPEVSELTEDPETGEQDFASDDPVLVRGMEEAGGFWPATAAMIDRLRALPGIGNGRALAVLEGVLKHKGDIMDLMQMHRVLETKGAAALSAPNLAPSGRCYKIVVTGDLEGWGREAFEELVESMGHEMVGSVSRKTDFLITNFPSSGTGKIKKAKDLGVPILSEKEALEKLGIATPAPRGGAASAGQLEQVALEDI